MKLPTAGAPSAGSALSGDPRATASAVTASVVAGAVTGLVAAFSYYDRLLRPLAHTFGLWILLAVIVSAGQTPRRAILRASTAVFAAIVAFHLGQRLIYRIKYHGDAYTFSANSLALWCLLALAAGVVLGPVFARIGRSGWSGSAAAAAAIGLLVADVRRRTHNYPGDSATLLTFAVLAVIIVIVLTAVSRRQLVRTALLILPCVVLAYFLVSTPLLELLLGISR
ncbi:MAG: DUF6518 family protein [Nocardioidaceae bacterium]